MLRNITKVNSRTLVQLRLPATYRNLSGGSFGKYFLSVLLRVSTSPFFVLGLPVAIFVLNLRVGEKFTTSFSFCPRQKVLATRRRTLSRILSAVVFISWTVKTIRNDRKSWHWGIKKAASMLGNKGGSGKAFCPRPVPNAQGQGSITYHPIQGRGPEFVRKQTKRSWWGIKKPGDQRFNATSFKASHSLHKFSTSRTSRPNAVFGSLTKKRHKR